MLIDIDERYIVDPEDIRDILHRKYGWKSSEIVHNEEIAGTDILFTDKMGQKNLLILRDEVYYGVLGIEDEGQTINLTESPLKSIDLKEAIGANNLMFVYTTDGQTLILAEMEQ